MAGRPFVEVAPLAEATPLDAWGGWDGQGFDGKLFLSTGARQGGTSRILQHDDRRGDAHWLRVVSEGGVETFNKIRDGVDPQTGMARLWVWTEGPDAGQSWLAYRGQAASAWAYEAIPVSGNAVGGRGLGVAGPADGRLTVGGAQDWPSPANGQLYQKGGGGVSLVRSHTPGLLWELEYEGPGGALWEFWNGFGGAATPRTYRAGVLVANPPGADISQAAWFRGALYAGGNLSDRDPRLYRYSGAWGLALAFSQASSLDHVVHVPRGTGELWAVGQDPLQVAWSLDGATWTGVALPAVATGADTNHLTALAYYGGRVWVLARDAGAGHTRVFREDAPSTLGGGRRLLQIA